MKVLLLLNLIPFFILSQNSICHVEDEGTITDIDNNTYRTVKIGNQWWMAENLRTSKFADGTPLTNVRSYENETSMDRIFGKYYHWDDIASGPGQSKMQGPCPNGWHVPSDEEWMTLEAYIGMPKSEREDIGFRGRSGEGTRIVDPNFTTRMENGNCTGLSLIPGGYVDRNSAEAGIKGVYFTSSLDKHKNTIWVRVFHNQGADIYGIGREIRSNVAQIRWSCRCIQD